MNTTCAISGKNFVVSSHEVSLREKFSFGDILPQTLPKYRFQYLGAFWPQWALHNRKCDRTGKAIISIFRPNCPYPVWQRDEWLEHANPPSRDFDFTRPFFEQAWELFQKSPLPHIFQSHNQNCEYTDDWYHSKNCYLCHSGQNNEDCRYCYGCDSLKSVHNGIFSFDSELCMDLINSSSCFHSLFLLNCKRVYDSAFLYDCRDCSDCLFCFNLRNKKYCFANEQLSKEAFEQKRAEWDFSSLKVYQYAKTYFAEMMFKSAWHRALQIDKCENSTGNFIRNSKDCENCYLLSNHESCVNVSFCGPNAKFILDSLGTVGSELTYMSSLPVYCYDARFCFSVNNCRFVQYSAYLQNCQYCFGCCGLMNRKYHIFNQAFSKAEYEVLVPKIMEHMLKTGESGNFFPEYFAPNPYEESFSGFHFPLNQANQNFRRAEPLEKITQKTAELEDIPDSLEFINVENESWLTKQIFWDKEFERPFQIQKADLDFARKLKCPLPNSYYMNQIQGNFRWMPFSGELRETVCAKTGARIQTNWSEAFDGRILSEKAYVDFIK